MSQDRNKERLKILLLLTGGLFCFNSIARGVVNNSPANESKFINENVEISANVASSVYTYKICNKNKTRIVEAGFPQHAAYNFLVPKDWETENSEGFFRARATAPTNGIAENQICEFSMRVSSAGAILGFADIEIKLESGEKKTVKGVWVPVEEPKSYVRFVMGMIFFIALTHCLILSHTRLGVPDKKISGV